MKKPRVNPFLSVFSCPIAQADVAIVSAAIDLSCSYLKGTADAPEAILAASDQLELFDEDCQYEPLSRLKVHTAEPFRPERGENIDGALVRWEAYLNSLPRVPLLIGLGGEHSITPALVRKCLPAEGTVIQLDAHPDLRQEYEGTPNSHACAMSRVLDLGHDLLQVGVRCFTKEEFDRTRNDPRIRSFSANQLRHPREWEGLLAIVEKLAGPVYLSIDSDVFDTSVIPTTGTPIPGGLNWWQVQDLVEALFVRSKAQVLGADIVEVMPGHPIPIAQFAAAKLAAKVIAFWGKGRSVSIA